jgi:outer membrane protein
MGYFRWLELMWHGLPARGSWYSTTFRQRWSHSGIAVAIAVLFAGCQAPSRQPPIWQPPPIVADDSQTEVESGPDAFTEPDLPEDPHAPLQLTIEQAVILALRNNRALRVQQYGPLIAGTFEQRERAVFDPAVRARVQASQAQRQQTDPATGTVFDLQTEQQLGEIGIGQQLPTGTNLGLDFSHSHTDDDRRPEQHAPRVGLSLTQALLRGFGRDANLAAIRIAQLESHASQWELRAFVEALAADVEITFWDYALAQRELEIFQSSLQLAQQQLDVAQRRLAAQDLPEIALFAPQAEIARRNEDLINAQVRLQQLRLRLLRLIDPPIAAPWQRPLQLLTDVTIPEIELDPLEEHMALALRMRPEINEARLRIEQGRLEVVRTRNGLLPRLDLFLTLGKTGFADSFGEAYRELFQGRGYDLAAGLSFEYPLGNRAARSDHRRASLQRQRAGESLRNLAQLVELDVQQAYLEVQRTRAQIEATHVTRELREQTLRAEEAQEAVGRSTALLVAQAQRDLLESRIAEVRAIVNHRQSIIELYRLDGSLLLRRAIDAPGDNPPNAIE